MTKSLRWFVIYLENIKPNGRFFQLIVAFLENLIFRCRQRFYQHSTNTQIYHAKSFKMKMKFVEYFLDRLWPNQPQWVAMCGEFFLREICLWFIGLLQFFQSTLKFSSASEKTTLRFSHFNCTMFLAAALSPVLIYLLKLDFFSFYDVVKFFFKSNLHLIDLKISFSKEYFWYF